LFRNNAAMPVPNLTVLRNLWNSCPLLEAILLVFVLVLQIVS
jgi:hypothetical protein